jgi:hypothetical protein
LNVLGNILSSPPDVSARYSAHVWPQAGIFDHEGHQLGWGAANAEEFQTLVLDKVSKGWMSG